MTRKSSDERLAAARTVVVVADPVVTGRALRAASSHAAPDAPIEVIVLDELTDLAAVAAAAEAAGIAHRITLTTYAEAGPELDLAENPPDQLFIAAPKRETSSVETAIQRLANQTKANVAVVRPKKSETRRVLAAIEPDADAKHSGLNELVLQVAEELAGETGEVHVASVWVMRGKSLFRANPFSRVSSDELDEWEDGIAARSRTLMQDFVDHYATDPARVVQHLRRGSIGDELDALIAELDVTHVVVGSVARSGVAGLLLGNTADGLINRTACSVFVVKAFS